jgi:hypothetical protein
MKDIANRHSPHVTPERSSINERIFKLNEPQDLQETKQTMDMKVESLKPSPIS